MFQPLTENRGAEDGRTPEELLEDGKSPAPEHRLRDPGTFIADVTLVLHEPGLFRTEDGKVHIDQ